MPATTRKQPEFYYYKVARDQLKGFNDRFPGAQLKVIMCIDRDVNGPAQNIHFDPGAVAAETGHEHTDVVQAMAELHKAGEITMHGDPAQGPVEIYLPKKYWLPLKTRKDDRYLKIPDWVLLNMRFFSRDEFAIIMFVLWRTRAFPVERKALAFRFIMRGLKMSHGRCQRRVQKLKQLGALRLCGRGERGTQLMEVPDLAPNCMPRKPDLKPALRFQNSGTVLYPNRVQSELVTQDNKINFNDRAAGEGTRGSPRETEPPPDGLPRRKRPYENRMARRLQFDTQKYPELIIKIRRRNLEHLCRIHGDRRTIAAGRLCERSGLPITPRNLRFALRKRCAPPREQADREEDERVTLFPRRKIRKPDAWDGTRAVFYAQLPDQLLALLEHQFPRVHFRNPPPDHIRNHWKRYAPDFDEIEDVVSQLDAMAGKFGQRVVQAAIRYHRIFEQGSLPHVHDLMMLLYGEVEPRRGLGSEFTDHRLITEQEPARQRIQGGSDGLCVATELSEKLRDYLGFHIPGLVVKPVVSEIRVVDENELEIIPPAEVPAPRPTAPRTIEVGSFDPIAIEMFKRGYIAGEGEAPFVSRHGRTPPVPIGADMVLDGLQAMKDDTS